MRAIRSDLLGERTLAKSEGATRYEGEIVNLEDVHDKVSEVYFDLKAIKQSLNL